MAGGDVSNMHKIVEFWCILLASVVTIICGHCPLGMPPPLNTPLTLDSQRLYEVMYFETQCTCNDDDDDDVQ